MSAYHMGRARLMHIGAYVMAATLMAGCVTAPAQYRPIVDPKFGDAEAYEANLGECRALAAQVNQANTAAAGAVAGAVLGTVIGAIFGLRGKSLAQVAGSTAVVNSVRGAEYAGLSQQQIIGRCLSARGYVVLL